MEYCIHTQTHKHTNMGMFKHGTSEMDGIIVISKILFEAYTILNYKLKA